MEIKTLQLSENITCISSIDADLRVFDIIMETEFGTTYNSYLVKGTEKTALFETTKMPFWNDYVKILEKNVELDKIDYIILDHTEPDHAGSLGWLVDKCPNATVVGSAAAIMFLKAMTNKKLKSMRVKTGDKIDLGGKTLEFISAPFLHWPDSIFTYIPEDEMLFTCDVFGCHFADNRILLSQVKDRAKEYQSALAYYNAMIFGPFGNYVLRALESIKDLKIKMIGVGHGPVLDTDLNEIMSKYEKWAQPVRPEHKPGDKFKVFLGYVSAYGFTSEIGDKIKNILEATGNIEVNKYDISVEKHSLMNNYLNRADGVILGSCTINADAVKPMYDLLSHTSVPLNSGKPAAAFGSYGWSGEGPLNLESRLRDLKFKIVTPALRVNFLPGQSEEEMIKRFSENYINALYAENAAKERQGGTKKWRCIVCGEVYEGELPPDICPACGVGADKFEEVVVEKIGFTTDKKEKFAIIGGGIAGLTAAENIRLRNKSAEITIFSEENSLPYYRPKLSEMLSEEVAQKEFLVKNEEWFQAHRIEMIKGSRVSALDLKAKKIQTENGESVSFDKLILAQGSFCVIPSIPGSKNQGVCSLRNHEDLLKIREQLKTTKKCVVIGGGLLGLEAAWHISQLGIDLSVVEISDRILPYQLNEEGSYIFEKIIQNRNIRIVKEKFVKSIQGEGKVTGVVFEDGEKIACDMVLFAIGICPNIRLLEGKGFTLNRGIKVNDKMETGIENVWACGDVTEFNGIVYGNWEAAINQAKVAGANAAGDAVTFYPPYKAYVLNSMGTEVFSSGDLGLDEKNFQAYVGKDYEQSQYKKAIFRNNRMVGAMLIGESKNSLKYLQGIKNGMSAQDFLKQNLL